MWKKARRYATSAAVLLSFCLAGGCAYVQAISKKSSEKSPEEWNAEVDKAIADKNLEGLAGYCSNKTRMDNSAQEKACKAYIELLGARSDLAQLKKICDGEIDEYYSSGTLACGVFGKARLAAFDSAAADCEKVLSSYEEIEPNVDDHGKEALFFKAAKRLAECKKWELFFTKFVTKTKHDRGIRVLKETAKAGVDLRAVILAHLAAHKAAPFDYFDGSTAARWIVSYLLQSESVGNCADFVPYAVATTKTPIKEHWVRLFGRTGCKEAADVVASYLSSGEGMLRKEACFTLGAIGARKHIARMKPFAATDPAYKMRGLIRIFYVRDACKGAILKLSSR